MLRISFLEKNIVLIMLAFAFAGLELHKIFFWAINITHLMLSIIAFCVGLALEPKNFKDAWKDKKFIVPVLMFKYFITPTLTFVICLLARVPITDTIGLVTLACCPAANTGNIMCYLSKGNTAMIVLTTITGALLAPLITPVIIYLLLHKIVYIKLSEITLLIVTGITIPMAIGIFTSYFFPKTVRAIRSIIPTVGIVSVGIIIAAILSQHHNEILELGIKLPIICTFLIINFFIIGFMFSRLIKCNLKNSIAMSFEIGTFDGVLGILLVLQIAGYKATLSVVIFAVLNLIIGSTASKIFNSRKLIMANL